MKKIPRLKKSLLKKVRLIGRFSDSGRKLSLIFGWTIFLTLLLLCVTLVSPILPTKKFVTSSIVKSGSMEPTIKSGSLAFIKPIIGNMVKEGDIVTFTAPKGEKQTIIHRVVKVGENDKGKVFTTKGDGNDSEDPWIVYPVFVQGKYLFSIPYLGYFASAIKTSRGFIILVGIPAFILSIFQILKIKEGIDELEKASKKSRKSRVNPAVVSIILFFATALFSFGTIKQTTLASFSAAVGLKNLSFSVSDFGNAKVEPTPIVYSETPSVSSEISAQPDQSSPTPSPERTPEIVKTLEVTPTPEAYLGPPCVICGEDVEKPQESSVAQPQ